jgi:transcriptional regulator with XRE-family HTH domain
MHSGKTLKLLRQYKDISQKELALRINKSQETISNWEKHEYLDGEILDLLLKALKINREEWERFRKLPPPPAEIAFPLLTFLLIQECNKGKAVI